MSAEVNHDLSTCLWEFCKQSHRTMNFWRETVDEIRGRVCKMWHTRNICFGGEPKWEAHAEVHELANRYRWRIRNGASRTWTKGYAPTAEDARAAAMAALHDRGYLSPDHMKGRMGKDSALKAWIS